MTETFPYIGFILVPENQESLKHSPSALQGTPRREFIIQNKWGLNILIWTSLTIEETRIRLIEPLVTMLAKQKWVLIIHSKQANALSQLAQNNFGLIS